MQMPLARLSAIVGVSVVTSLMLYADDRTVGVYVVLADNASQGIVPVPAAFGNGDDPEHNLYWGCADGLKADFERAVLSGSFDVVVYIGHNGLMDFALPVLQKSASHPIHVSGSLHPPCRTRSVEDGSGCKSNPIRRARRLCQEPENRSQSSHRRLCRPRGSVKKRKKIRHEDTKGGSGS